MPEIGAFAVPAQGHLSTRFGGHMTNRLHPAPVRDLNSDFHAVAGRVMESFDWFRCYRRLLNPLAGRSQIKPFGIGHNQRRFRKNEAVYFIRETVQIDDRGPCNTDDFICSGVKRG